MKQLRAKYGLSDMLFTLFQANEQLKKPFTDQQIREQVYNSMENDKDLKRAKKAIDTDYKLSRFRRYYNQGRLLKGVKPEMVSLRYNSEGTPTYRLNDIHPLSKQLFVKLCKKFKIADPRLEKDFP